MTTTGNEPARSLANARFEMLPLRGAAERARAFPAGTTVTVTASPRKGIDATVDLAAELATLDLHVVPHLSARLVRDTAQLSGVLDRLDDRGICEVFVVAGDAANPAGEFPDALSLLRAMEGLGRLPGRIGITGYPESHALISDDATITAMTEKSRYAHYLVSQMCFDTHTIASWVKSVRARGITLPVYIGAPGSVEFTKLLKIGMSIGLGDSLRFLRKQRGAVTRMLTRYTPEELVDGLAPYCEDEEYRIAGWHLYTFNEVESTLRWRDSMAGQKEVPA